MTRSKFQNRLASTKHRSRTVSQAFVLWLRASISLILGMGFFSPSQALGQGAEWLQSGQSGPSPRVFHAMTYDANRNITVLFGGVTSLVGNWEFNGDTWEWDGTTWTKKVTSGPSPRHAHSMAFDAHRGVTVLFGGYGDSGANGETWEWNGTTWNQRDVSGPSPRYVHTMSYDSDRHVTVLFGGFNNIDPRGPFGDTWEWDGNTWTERSVIGPSARFSSPMVFDANRGVSVLCGGGDGITWLGDTWEWDGIVWTQRSVSGPPGLVEHAMAYDSARGVTTLFGSTVPGDGETWEWDGANWNQLQIDGPSPRRGHAMVYDTARGKTVLLGGRYDNMLSSESLWQLHTICDPPRIATQPVDQAVGVDAPVLFVVEAFPRSGCMAQLRYQWQRRDPSIIDPAAPNAWIDIVDGGGFVNAQTAALAITHPTPALATGYRCRIVGGCHCEPRPSSLAYTTTVNFSVACPADFNADGGIDFQDIEAFFGRWEAGC